jgi:hypothetical protein
MPIEDRAGVRLLHEKHDQHEQWAEQDKPGQRADDIEAAFDPSSERLGGYKAVTICIWEIYRLDRIGHSDSPLAV